MSLPAAVQPRPPVEPLEPRRLFAAIGLQNGVLSVTGTAGVSNTITVGLSSDHASVVASVTYESGRGTRAAAHTLTRSFPLLDNIKSVKITGSNKADTITVDQTYGSFPIPCKIYGGAGNDTIMGGDEPDLIFGQAGNDSIDGGGGNDTLYGGGGNDTLIGGAGNNYLAGGTGHDVELGSAGNDTIWDPFGPDTVLGGAGHNTFDIHSLRADVDNDYNDVKDTLHIIERPSTGSGSDNTLNIIEGILPFL